MKKMFLVFAISAMLFARGAFAAQLVMDGSTTMLSFAQAAVEQFMKANPGAGISVAGSGTGNGFKSLADGSAQIANASRFIKASEIKMCMDKKVYPIPFAVALDSLVPVIHRSNPVNNLTRSQLRDIFSGKITNWKEVGGDSRPIVVVGRDTSSGTYGAWQEMILDSGGKTRVTPRALVSASSGAVLSAVSNNKNAIGYEGMGFVTKTVKGVTVDGVKATAQNARNGQYPLARYLYMFTNGWPAGTVLDFINFMQGQAGQKIVADRGFVPLREMK